MKTHIILHHSAIFGEKRQRDQILAHHNKKWPEHGIAYHYLLERDGTVIPCRPEDSIGYHAGNWAMNVAGIGVCLAGDLRSQEPSEAQIRALNIVLHDLQARHGIPMSNILLHKEVRLGGGTECPGRELRSYITQNTEIDIDKAKKALGFAKGLRRAALERIVEKLGKK